MTTPATSATGGYLRPVGPGPAQDRALFEVLQPAFAGISGLPGNLVRPRWQPEPQLIPPAATCWMALGITDREADTFPWLGLFPNDAGIYQMQRHETFYVLTSIYDLGYSGEADQVAAELRDGLMIPQNGEQLAASGIYVVSDADITVAPTLFKQRWMYRTDLRVKFRRQITRDYSVLPLDSVTVELVTDDGQPPRLLNENT